VPLNYPPLPRRWKQGGPWFPSGLARELITLHARQKVRLIDTLAEHPIGRLIPVPRRKILRAHPSCFPPFPFTFTCTFSLLSVYDPPVNGPLIGDLFGARKVARDMTDGELLRLQLCYVLFHVCPIERAGDRRLLIK